MWGSGGVFYILQKIKVKVDFIEVFNCDFFVI